MQVQFKGDTICMVCLVVALFTMLYFQLGHISIREEKAKGQEKTAAKNSRAFVLQKQFRRTLPMKYTRLESQEKQVTSPLLTNTMFDFRLYLRNKDNRKFPLLINQPKKCMRSTEGPFLLIAIKSLVEEFDRREVVRKTWGREGLVTGVEVQRVFLLGIPKNMLVQPTWEAQIHQESHLYHDILLWDFMDTFFNLTLKEINFLSWVDEFCSQTKFIFKGDDDVFVNMENIINFAQSCNPSEELFVGDIIYNAQPIREPQSKYYIPEMIYGLGLYPAYAGGGGFLLSVGTLKKLIQACAEVELFPIDDVFLGMCLQRINLEPILHEGFKTFGILKPSEAPNLQTFDPCFYKDLMVVHGLNVAEIWLMWNLVHSPRLSCAENKQISKVFQWKKKTKDPLKNYAAEGLARRLGFRKRH